MQEGTYGYCVIDPEHGLGSHRLVEGCPPESRRRIRLVPYNIGRLDLRESNSLRLVCL